MIPLCYAFNLSVEQIHSITGVLLDDRPIPILGLDFATYRKASWNASMMEIFKDVNVDDFVSPDALLSAIGKQWGCTFTEIPLDYPDRLGYMRYRLFRPIFLTSMGTEQNSRYDPVFC